MKVLLLDLIKKKIKFKEAEGNQNIKQFSEIFKVPKLAKI